MCPYFNVQEVFYDNKSRNIQYRRHRQNDRCLQKQLRHWEAREFISAPMRIVCGQRAYRHFTKRQVEQIQAIKKLLDEGFTLSHASRLARKSSERRALKWSNSHGTVKLSGVSFGNAQSNIKTFGSPDIRWFALVREPDNQHDPNAIRVALFGEFFMGYIPKDIGRSAGTDDGFWHGVRCGVRLRQQTPVP